MSETDVKDVKQMCSLLHPDNTANPAVSKCNTKLCLMSFPLLLEINKNKQTTSKCYTYSVRYFKNFLLMQNQSFRNFLHAYLKEMANSGLIYWNVQHNTGDLNQLKTTNKLSNL